MANNLQNPNYQAGLTEADLEAMKSATKHLDLDIDYSFPQLNTSFNGTSSNPDLAFQNEAQDLKETSVTEDVEANDEEGSDAEQVVTKPSKKVLPDLNSEDSFPSLGSSAGKSLPALNWGSKSLNGKNGATGSASKPKVVSNLVTEVINLSISQSPSIINQLKQSISKIQKRLSVSVEISSSKLTGNTTFIIKGKPEAVAKSVREIKSELSPKETILIKVPASVTRFILGSKGRNLHLIQNKTMTAINVPRREEGDEEDSLVEISITGDLAGAKLAKKEIEDIVREKVVKKEIKISDIDTKYYPFLSGPNNSRISEYVKDTSVTLKIPFLVGFTEDELVNIDSAITVLGDSESASLIHAKLLKEAESLVESLKTLSLPVPKAKHRFLIGPKGSHFKEIFSATGCIVELPNIDDSSEMVTISGFSQTLSKALQIIMEKVDSAFVASLDLSKVHKANASYISNLIVYLNHSKVLQKIESDHLVQIHLPSVKNKSTQMDIVGKASANVNKAKTEVEALLKSLPPSNFATVSAPFELHNFIAGVDRSKINKISEKQNVKVILPETKEKSNTIVLFSKDSNKENLDTAIKALEKDIKGREKIEKKVLSAPAKIHRHIIGPNGSTLSTILGEEGESPVNVIFGSKPTSGENRPTRYLQTQKDLKPDQISINGPSNDVTKVAQELEKLIAEMENYEQALGYTINFTIPSRHSAHVVGKGGANIQRLKETYDVKVDVDSKSSKDETSIKVQGLKKYADKVKEDILALVDKLADQTEEKLKILSLYHRSIIGQQGKYVKRLEDKYAVIIKFPRTNSSQSDDEDEEEESKANSKLQLNKDEILIRGGRKGVASAKAEILEIVEYEKENGHKVTFKVLRAHLPHVLGRSGSSINDIKDSTQTRIDVDKSKDDGEDESTITIQGTKAGIKEAQKLILTIVSEIESKVTQEIEISNSLHRTLIGSGGSKIRQLIAKCQGLEPNDPEVNHSMVKFPKDDSTKVIVKGEKSLVDKVVQALKEIADHLEDQTTITITIDPEHFSSLIGRGGSTLKAIMDKHSVEIQFPRREVKGPDASKITITGLEANCEACKDDLLSRIPDKATFTFPQKYHHFILNKNKNLSRKLQQDFQVKVDFPSAHVPKPTFQPKVQNQSSAPKRIDDDASNSLDYECHTIQYPEGDSEVEWTLKGAQSNLDKATNHLNKLLKEAQSSNAVLRLYVPQNTHRLIIGRGGSTINQLRADSKCEIELPVANGAQRRHDTSTYADGTAIVIIGDSSNTEVAKQLILELVQNARN